VLDLGCEYDDEVHPIFAITSHVHKVVWCQALWWRRMSFMVQLGLTVWMCCHSMFKVSLYHSWCAPKLRHNFTTMVYSILLKVGKIVLKMTETLWKNSLIVVRHELSM
jgi:hypothetical protein